MKFLVSWRWSKKKTDAPDEVLQKVLLHPKGVMPWSKPSISIFHKRSQEDIVYLDATGSTLKRSENSEGPFYVYELVVRNPKKGSSPFPVATYVTCDHTTACVQYFLSVFQTDRAKQYRQKNTSPLMVVCEILLSCTVVVSTVACQTPNPRKTHVYEVFLNAPPAWWCSNALPYEVVTHSRLWNVDNATELGKRQHKMIDNFKNKSEICVVVCWYRTYRFYIGSMHEFYHFI